MMMMMMMMMIPTNQGALHVECMSFDLIHGLFQKLLLVLRPDFLLDSKSTTHSLTHPLCRVNTSSQGNNQMRPAINRASIVTPTQHNQTANLQK